MKISKIGTDCVVLIAGVCLEDFRNNIIYLENDKKINILNKGQVPICKSRLKETMEKIKHY